MSVLLPPRLKPNDLIGIISPASPLIDEKFDKYQAGLRYLAGKGFRTVEGKNVFNIRGYLAGTDAERANDLNSMIRNPEIKAIFCSRGGFGTPRILDLVDYSALEKNPKIICGYSDITALQLSIYNQTGLVTYSGPMIAQDLGHPISPFTEQSFWDVLMNPDFKTIRVNENEKVLQNGVGSGPLLGGCLHLVTSLIGTRFQPDFAGALLFLEDIGEPVYRLDRCFAQLKNSGILDNISGLLLGQFVDIKIDPLIPSLSLDEMIGDYVSDMDVPVIANFPYGHGDTKYTLPIGMPARLDAFNRTLTFQMGGDDNA